MVGFKVGLFGGSKPRPTACDIILNFKIARNLYCKK